MRKKYILPAISVFLLLINSTIKLSGAEPGNTRYTDPYILTLHPAREMNICWLTSRKPGVCFILYGTDKNRMKTIPAKTWEIRGLKTVDQSGNYTVDLPVFQQIVRLKNLKKGTKYYYQVVTDHEITGYYDFTTAPGRGKQVKFVLLSDLQLEEFSRVTANHSGRQGADFIIYNGDCTNTPCRAGEWFTVPGTPEEDCKRWFNVMQQKDNGCRLMQHIPIFPSPGNHELDDQEMFYDKKRVDRSKMSMSIYLQLFRPLYDTGEECTLDSADKYNGYPGANGRHWYSADYGDLHIISLSAFRWYDYPAAEAPGWPLFDDIKKRSGQYRWLKKDLAGSGHMKYKWVTEHWNIFSRSRSTGVAFTDPVSSGTDGQIMEYPFNRDYLLNDLIPLLERHGVNAMSFGHSHVYERFVIRNIHYIQASSNANNYRRADDPPCSGQPGCTIFPVADERRFMSFMLVTVDSRGITAQGIQTTEARDDSGHIIGYPGRVFDSFRITEGGN